MSLSIAEKKIIILKCHETSDMVEDRLHRSCERKAMGKCSSSNEGVCFGSVWLPPSKATKDRNPDDVKKDAEVFLKEYYASLKSDGVESYLKRFKEIEEEINSEGIYNISERELAFGAKLAWRNAERCIGRIQWNKLQLFDARNVKTTVEIQLLTQQFTQILSF